MDANDRRSDATETDEAAPDEASPETPRRPAALPRPDGAAAKSGEDGGAAKPSDAKPAAPKEADAGKSGGADAGAKTDAAAKPDGGAKANGGVKADAGGKADAGPKTDAGGKSEAGAKAGGGGGKAGEGGGKAGGPRRPGAARPLARAGGRNVADGPEGGAAPARAGARAKRRPAVMLEAGSSGLARRARRRARFNAFLLWLSFALLVAAPSGLSIWYLHARAADQYASEVSFAVRSLDGQLPSPVMDLFGGAADSTAGDSQMLFEYLQSQPMVQRIDAAVDLAEVYNRPEADRLFSLGEGRTIEEMVDYWNLAAGVSYDSTSGIIYVEVRAFRPDDAQRVGEAVLAESERLINGLTDKARSDSVRFARADLEEAEQRLRDARLALQEFRGRQGTADVTGDITQEMTLIGELRAQRSLLQSDYDSRKDLLGEDSPTLSALARRLASLDAQIAEAEARIADAPGGGGGARGDRATLTQAAGEQERLQVEVEFATSMYVSAQAALEAARAEARRSQRYLATHIEPTLSQEAQYPRRTMWSVAIFVVSLLIWSILLLIVSSIRDRN